MLVTPLDSVTRITTVAGAVRGNHRHDATHQWTLVISGRLLTAQLADGVLRQREHGPGDLISEPAGIPHAWRALADCTVLVFTKGPRSGQGYESDTTRLAVPLLEAQ